MDKITSFQTLIGTLYKKYNKASVYGKLDLKTIYLLNLINRFLYECPTCNNNDINNCLINLVIKLKYSDKEICNYNLDRNYYINNEDIFNNVVLNNTPIKVINTPPVIEDPEPSNPQVGQPPVLCNYTKNVSINAIFSKHLFTANELSNCLIDPNNPLTGSVKNMKIISLPLYNPLTYQGVNVTIGQVIDLTTLNGSTNKLLYESIITQNVNDNFKYILSTTSYPNVYTDLILTMNIKDGNPI